MSSAKIKSIISHIVCIVLGLANFFVYGEVYYKGHLNLFQLFEFFFERLDDPENIFILVLALLEWFLMLAGILFAVWSVISLILVCTNVFSGHKGAVKAKKACEVGTIIMGSLLLALFLLLIVYFFYIKATSYYDPSFDLAAVYYILLISNMAAPILLKTVNRVPKSGGVTYTYVCASCGKKAKATDRFCSVCGGMVEKEAVVEEAYHCINCGRKAKSTDRFCIACGGMVEKKAVVEEAYHCANCGRKAKSTDRFCSACGGVVEKKAVVEEAYRCANCGRKAKSTDRFCIACGAQITAQETSTPQSENLNPQI